MAWLVIFEFKVCGRRLIGNLKCGISAAVQLDSNKMLNFVLHLQLAAINIQLS